MFEARFDNGSTMKRLMDAIVGLIDDGLFDCSNKGLSLQAMDTSHVALVALVLRCDAFSPYRCDRNISLGINFKT